MLGGLYGDLAASTYLRDPQIFYHQLFDDKATLSEYSLSILATYAFLKGIPRALSENCKGCADIVKRYFDDADNKIFNLSNQARFWRNEGFIGITPVAPGMLLNRLATFYQYSSEANNLGRNVIIDSCAEKEEGYANIVLGEIITLLRKGYTKKEVLANVNPVFTQTVSHWNWKESDTPLCLLMRAWDCFYNSFDFGSAIHNAVRYPNSNTRQIASLTGLIAESMYGCWYYFKKKRFCGKNEFYVELGLPAQIRNTYKLPYPYQDGWENRTFFPKNCALTNVERHFLKPFKSRLNGILLLPNDRQLILYAFNTDWENRFGFYLDDGWIYCYRSFYLLGRFKLNEKDSRYFIADVQQSDEMPDGMNIDQCIACALHSARVPGVPSFEQLKS